VLCNILHIVKYFVYIILQYILYRQYNKKYCNVSKYHILENTAEKDMKVGFDGILSV